MLARSAAFMLLTIVIALAAMPRSVQVQAHSWLVKPVSRETHGAVDENNTVGCPTNKAGKSTSFTAGETIDVRYWRNNHLGGFIRWSMVPRGKESKATFDANVFAYTCRESGPECVPHSDDWFTPDGAAANSVRCGDKVTLPDWLSAGDYVLQWTWLGVGGKNGSRNAAEATFRSCADITLTTAGPKAAAPTCPVFIGGDRVTKLAGKSNASCFYFRTAEIAVAPLFRGIDPDSDANYRFGVPAAVAACVGGKTPDDTTTVASDATPMPTKRRCRAKRAARSLQQQRVQ